MFVKTTRFVSPKRLLWLFALTTISVLLLLPLPWEKQTVFFWGFHKNGERVGFAEPLKFNNRFLNIFVDSFNVPTQLRHYDIHFVNTTEENASYDLIFRVILRNDRFGDYAKTYFGTSPYENSLDYDIYSSKKVVVKAVPIGVLMSYSSIPMCIAKSDGSCPDNIDFLSSDNNAYEKGPQGMNVFVAPNLFSWFFSVVLIFAFWVVVINNAVDLFKIRRVGEAK